MPIKENITSFRSYLVMAEYNVSESGSPYPGAIFDTINCNNGIGFALSIMVNSGTNTKYTMHLFHGDEPDLSDAEIIPLQNHVYGSRSGLRPYVMGEMNPGDLDPSMKMTTEGVFSTKRYLRGDLVISDWDAPESSIAIMTAFLWPDLIPVPQRLGAII